MRHGIERKLSDLDRELEQTGGRMGRLQLIGNVYIMSGAFLAILMLVMQTALSIGGLFGSGGTGRRCAPGLLGHGAVRCGSGRRSTPDGCLRSIWRERHRQPPFAEKYPASVRDRECWHQEER